MPLVTVNIFIIIFSSFLMTSQIPLSILGLVQLVICCIAIYKNSPVRLPFGIMFLLLVYLFHSGFAFLFLLGYSFSEFSMTYYNINDYGRAQIFIELSIFLFTVGYVNKKRMLKPRFQIKKTREVQGKFFVAFFLLCLPLYIAAIYTKVTIAKESGYLATFELTSTPLFRYGNLFIESCLPMSTLLFVFYKRNVFMCKCLAVIMLMLSIYSMTSGQRIMAITSLISLGVIYFNVVSEINKKNILILSAITALLVIVLPIVSRLRGSGNVDIENITDTYNGLQMEMGNGFLFMFIQEFGGTVISLIVPMVKTGESAPYGFGLTYMLAPLSLSPKLPLDLVESDLYKYAMHFITQYPEAKYINFGGSILGEAFANFGWFGCFVSFFVGLLIKLVDNSIHMVKEGNISYYTLLLIFIIPELMVWIRDSFAGVIGFVYIVLYFLWFSSVNVKNRQNSYGQLPRIS